MKRKDPVKKASRILNGLLIASAALVVAAVVGGLLYWFAYRPWANEQFTVTDEPLPSKDPQGQKLRKRTLQINGINHGMQVLPNKENPEPWETDWRRLATAYYHSRGPVGRAMNRTDWFADAKATFRGDARLPASLLASLGPPQQFPAGALAALWSEPPFGVVGIGAGTMASYARPYQHVDFYERNLLHGALSLAPKGQTPQFTFLADALNRGAFVRAVYGRERTSIDESQVAGFYHSLFIETARGDPSYVSTELMTKEAMSACFRMMTDEGMACYHVSSRYYHLAPAIEQVARSLGLSAVYLHQQFDERDPNPDYYRTTSDWVFVARDRQTLLTSKSPPRNGENDLVRSSTVDAAGVSLWTDADGQPLGPHRFGK